MSVYNGESYLKEAIESVMNQTFSDWELIVINDCSTDSTATILEECSKRDSRIKVHTNEVNLKLPTSLNKAISFSMGKYIARIRIEECKMLLREGRLSMGQIASDMGFSSLQHFSRQFHTICGMTPSQYVRSLR